MAAQEGAHGEGAKRAVAADAAAPPALPASSLFSSVLVFGFALVCYYNCFEGGMVFDDLEAIVADAVGGEQQPGREQRGD